VILTLSRRGTTRPEGIGKIPKLRLHGESLSLRGSNPTRASSLSKATAAWC